jgi:inner membrane protein
VAVLGRRVGPRRAALAGGLLGTLPDLDVFLASSDPIESFVQHRGWTHSLFVHAALTPVIAEAVRLVLKPLRDLRLLAWAAVFLCLSTHALLDAATIYGTRLFWPFWTEPVALGAIFIIDPLYTLPLLVAMVWAFGLRNWTPRFGKALTICLGLSVAYLGWTLAAQHMIAGKANRLLASNNITPDRLIATPTPFNTVLWRAIVIDGERSFNLYIPVFGGPERARLYAYDRNLQFETCFAINRRSARLAWFSRGFYRLMVQDGEVVFADLRMGLTPNYAFRFVLARLEGQKLVPVPTRRLSGRGNIAEDLDWLITNLRGDTETRPAEAAALVAPEQYATLAGTDPQSTGVC